jgi:hypothetical protein
MASGIFQPRNSILNEEGIESLLNLPALVASTGNLADMFRERLTYQDGGLTDYLSNPIYQNFLKSDFYQTGPQAGVGTTAMTPVTLPSGETLMLPGSLSANQFKEYLASTPAGGAPVGIPTPVIEPLTPATGLPVGIPTPVPSYPMSLPTVSSPTTSTPRPTTPESIIPGFQSFSGSGREGIMNLLASRFRDLNLGMMNRLRNDPGSFYSRSSLDQTSSMPSGLQSLFFRSGNNLTEIPNSMNMIKRAVQRPSYTNTGIATSFTPNFVSLERRRRRR